MRSRRVVTEAGVAPGTVHFACGRIDRIADHGVAASAEILDVGDRIVMAGIVDTHVHINEPGRTEWEGFLTATSAAAAGGVTTLVDMPLNCIPVTVSESALREKTVATRDRVHVDVGFWGGVVPAGLPDLPALARAGVWGCKAFLCPSGIDDFPASDGKTLRAAMAILRDAGIPLLAHAELEGPTEDGRGGPSPDPTSYEGYLAGRPPSWEVNAIELLIRLSKETGCAVHIVHLSTAEALPILRQARAEGVPITVETCPHYLCLEAEAVPERNTAFKCAPPIRDRSNRDALWAGLAEGVIDFVVSDHSPCTP
ncbi:MAG: allantoinase AllB, partial [Myxococcales bacterium]|nr:allantoinase AllB [Myxococcales bacterium]